MKLIFILLPQLLCAIHKVSGSLHLSLIVPTNKSSHINSVAFDSVGLPGSFDIEKLQIQVKQLKDFLEAKEQFIGGISTVSVAKIAQLLGSQNRITKTSFAQLPYFV